MAQRYPITDAVWKTVTIGSTAKLFQAGGAASAQIKDLRGNNLTVYQDVTGSSTFANPVSADPDGRTLGYVEAPDFDVAISGFGITTDTFKVRNSPAGTFNVKSYGAVGNGTTDDTAAIQAAITAALAAPGGTTYIPQGSYKVTSQLTATGTGLTVTGAGPGLTTLLHQISGNSMFGALGSIGSLVAITAGSALGATQLTITSTTGLAQGDVILVRDTTQVINGSSGKTAAGVAGEIARVRSVDSATQITLYGRLDYAYTTSGDIRKLTLQDGLSISNLTIKNPNPGTMATTDRGISITRVRNVRIDNVEFRDMDAAGMRFDTVIDFEVTRCKFRDIRDLETANAPYCLILANACSHGLMANCWARYARHLFTAGGATSTEPQPAHVLVEDCIATEMSQAAFDTHPGARWITFSNCEAHNCANQGFQIRGPDTTLIEPIVSQATNGISFPYGADRAQIRGGRISGCDYGINNDSSNDLSVKGTRIDNPITAGFYIKESVSWAGTVLKLTLDDVTVNGNPTDAFKFDIWNDSFDLRRLYAPDATNKITSVSVNTPKIYGLYHDGFPGLIAPTTFGDWSASVTETANLAVFVRFVPQRNMTITKLRFVVTTAGGADDAFDVGIYGPNASSNVLTRLVSSGAVTGASGSVSGGGLNSTGPKAVTVSATKLVAGTVYFAAISWGTLGGAAATLGGAGANNTNANQLMSSTDVFYQIAVSKAASHPLPSTISGPSNIANAVKMGVME